MTGSGARLVEAAQFVSLAYTFNQDRDLGWVRQKCRSKLCAFALPKYVPAGLDDRGNSASGWARRQMTNMKLVAALTLAVLTTDATADVPRCKIEGFSDDIFITSPPDTNQNDGQYARIGISPGIGSKAFAFADPMGAHVFVELNADGTPVGLLTVQKDMRVINSRQSIDRSGAVFAPSQSAGRLHSMRVAKRLLAAMTKTAVTLLG